MAELVDALDLKSGVLQGTWGFDSLRAHQVQNKWFRAQLRNCKFDSCSGIAGCSCGKTNLFWTIHHFQMRFYNGVSFNSSCRIYYRSRSHFSKWDRERGRDLGNHSYVSVPFLAANTSIVEVWVYTNKVKVVSRGTINNGYFLDICTNNNSICSFPRCTWNFVCGMIQNEICYCWK